MTKLAKIIGYPLLFLFGFALFLYWFFPYDVLRDRITSAIEDQLGQGVSVEIKTLKPYWFTGVDVAGLTIAENAGGKQNVLLDCKRAIARASLFSLIFGRPNVSFEVEMGKGDVSGSVQRTEDSFYIDADFDDFDLAGLKMIAARTGLNISGKIDGTFRLKVDRQRPMYSTGKVDLSFVDIKLAASEVKVGEMSLPLPDLTLSKGGSAKVKMGIDKGVMSLDTVSMSGGDLAMALTGKIFLSAKAENYRFNLNGTFNASKTLADALPFLFIVDQQKQPDGSYPLTITGRLTKPSIKIGTFSLPL